MHPETLSLPAHANTAWPRSPTGELLVGGQPLSRHVARIGHTPCYLYDRDRIFARVQTLREVLSDGIHLHYAMKCNPMPALVCQLAQWVDGLDVASAGELQVACDSGVNPQHISFAGPGKTDRELAQAHAADVLINVESFREIKVLTDLAHATGRVARVAVRVNPSFEMKASGMKMSGGPKQFGVDAEQVPALLKAIGEAQLDFQGFHLFTGSQNLRAEVIADAQNKSYDLALQLAEHAPQLPVSINLGGGFGLPYFPGDVPLDLASVADNLNALSHRLQRDLPQAHLTIELGRYLVGEAGLYVTRVIDRKVSRGQTFIVVDGGMHHHLAASGNFGQVIRKNYPVAAAQAHTERETVNVVGPLCTPLDLLGDKVELDRVEPGDLVVLFQSGAYGLTASPRNFLGHPDAAEALI